MPQLAFLAAREIAWGLVRGRFEPRVALASFAAAGGDHALAERRKVL
jgi:hypothetical protein